MCMTIIVRTGKKNTSIPGKISLAQAWKTTTNPAGYIMSEKLDGMRAYWNGEAAFLVVNSLAII